MADFNSILTELSAAEKSLARLYGIALRLYNAGALTEEVRTRVHAERDAVYTAERAAYAALRASARALSPAAAAFDLDSYVREPDRWPELPPANAGSPPSSPVSMRRLFGGGPDEGYEVVQSHLWAAVVIIAIVYIAAAAYVLTVGIEELSTLAQRVVEVRANTDRYARQLAATEQRFNSCLSRGQTLERCADLFGVPQPPQERRPAPAGGWPWWGKALAVAGGVAVTGGLFWAYAAYRRRRTTRDDAFSFGFDGLVPANPEPLPSGGSSGGTGYNMDVR